MRKIIFILFVVISFSSFAQTKQDTILKIEKVFSRYFAQNPGCQLSIGRNDTLFFSKAWGISNLEDNTPLTTISVIEAGSVSKQFTAAAILLLEQQGKLSLEDDIRKYIPELPNYGTVIKLKHMIHHTSGLKDWSSIAGLTGWSRGTKSYNNEDALEMIARQKTLNNIPGTEYLYSNSNYNLMAIVVKRVSGMSLADFTTKYILTPAGMTHSQWRDNFNRVVPNRAIAYQKKDSIYEANMPFENAYGNGGLLTTTEDLLKWNTFYLSGKFGNPSLKSKQISTDTFNNGLTNYYGAGLLIQTNKGFKVIRHSGATASYRCFLEYYPQLNLSIAWLSNTSEFDNSNFNVINEIENIFIKTPISNTNTSNSRKEEAVNLPAEKLKTFQGWYRNDKSGYGMQILLKDEKLIVDNRTTLIPISEDSFKMGNDLLSFSKSRKFQLINDDKDSISYSPVSSPNLTLKTLKEYSGKYFSEESQSGITITQKNDTLTMTINSYSLYTLKPTYKDAFRIIDFGGVIYFERNKKNEIVNAKISQSRARNVAFLKKE